MAHVYLSISDETLSTLQEAARELSPEFGPSVTAEELMENVVEEAGLAYRRDHPAPSPVTRPLL